MPRKDGSGFGAVTGIQVESLLFRVISLLLAIEPAREFIWETVPSRPEEGSSPDNHLP